MNCGPDLNNRRKQILTAERLILHFHGVGPVPDGIGSEERNYWCEEDRFKSILGVDWRRVDDKMLDVEIDEAPKKIADALGCAIAKVSIPFGSYDRRVVRRLRRSEAKTVFTSDGGRAPLTGWMLPRESFRTSWL